MSASMYLDPEANDPNKVNAARAESARQFEADQKLSCNEVYRLMVERNLTFFDELVLRTYAHDLCELRRSNNGYDLSPDIISLYGWRTLFLWVGLVSGVVFAVCLMAFLYVTALRAYGRALRWYYSVQEAEPIMGEEIREWTQPEMVEGLVKGNFASAYVAESVRANSVLQEHSCILKHGLYFLDTKGVRVGNGLVVCSDRPRSKNTPYVVAPYHVWSIADRVGSHSGKTMPILDVGVWEETETDVVTTMATRSFMDALDIEPTEITTTTGTNTARFQTTATAKSPGIMSVGMITDGDVVGQWTYAGSTVGGCSGGGYYVRGKPVAMHLNGGQYNQGVNLDMVLNPLLKHEASSDSSAKFLWTYAQSSRRRLPIKSWGHEFIVFKDGRSYTLAPEDVDWDLVEMVSDSKHTKIPEGKYTDQAIEQRIIHPIEDVPAHIREAALRIYREMDEDASEAVEPVEVYNKLVNASARVEDTIRGEMEVLRGNLAKPIEKSDKVFHEARLVAEQLAAAKVEFQEISRRAEVARMEVERMKALTQQSNILMQQEKEQLASLRQQQAKERIDMVQTLKDLKLLSAQLGALPSTLATVSTKQAVTKSKRQRQREKAQLVAAETERSMQILREQLETARAAAAACSTASTQHTAETSGFHSVPLTQQYVNTGHH